MASLAIVEERSLNELTLGELLVIIENEHSAVVSVAQAGLRHAIRVGEALLASQQVVENGEWSSWARRTLPFGYDMAFRYMRLAAFQSHLEGFEGGIKDATRVLETLGLYRLGNDKWGGAGRKYSVETRETAVRMVAEGLSRAEVGRRLGIPKNTVDGWTRDKERRAAYERSVKRRRAREKAAREALRRQENDRAVRRIGGSVAECYSMIRKTAETVDRARADVKDNRVRVGLNAALSKLYAAEDDIVRALGIS